MSDYRTAPDGNPHPVTIQTPSKLSAKMLDALTTNMTAILEKTKSDAPVFFFDHLSMTETARLSEVAMPFHDFWLAFHDNERPEWKFCWYVHFVDGAMTGWGSGGGRAIKRIVRYNPFDKRDWYIEGQHSQSMAELHQAALYLYRTMIGAVDRINNSEQSTSEPPALKRLNAKRTKAGIKRLAPFIVVGAQRPEPAQENQGGGGWQQPPHKRRGHWRNLKSGKQIWINDYSVHGGGDTGRFYRVV